MEGKNTMSHKVLLRRLLMYSSCCISPQAFSSKCYLTNRDRRGICIFTHHLTEREIIYLQYLPSVFNVSSLQSINRFFPFISCPPLLNVNPSFHSPSISSAILGNNPHPARTQTHTRNLTIWPILAQIAAQVVQRRKN